MGIVLFVAMFIYVNLLVGGVEIELCCLGHSGKVLACMRCLSLYDVDRSRYCACCVCYWPGQRREVGKNVYKTLFFEL